MAGQNAGTETERTTTAEAAAPAATGGNDLTWMNHPKNPRSTRPVLRRSLARWEARGWKEGKGSDAPKSLPKQPADLASTVDYDRT